MGSGLCVCACDIIYVRTGLSGLEMCIKLEINILRIFEV